MTCRTITLRKDRFDEREDDFYEALNTQSQAHFAVLPQNQMTQKQFLVTCRTITLRKDKFDEREDDFYEALYTQSQAQFATYVQTGTVVNNYAHIFDLLIRLRQVSMPVTPCLAAVQ